jgi:hypothetical protein
MNAMDGKLKVIFSNTGLGPSVGSFAVCRLSRGKYRASEFVYCREHFHRIRPTGIILFHTRSRDVNRTVAFLKKVERKLKIKNKSKFYYTQRITVFAMEVSPWWNNYSVRRSFLTVLLRAGRNYKPRNDNFDFVLHEGNKYLKETSVAVERFMAGNTRLKGKFCGGWVAEFYLDYEATRLVKP